MDITERRELNERLRRNNELLAGVIENLPCGLAVFDDQRRLLTHNAQLAELLTLPPSLLEARTTTFEDLAPPQASNTDDHRG